MADADPLAWPRERLRQKRKASEISVPEELGHEAALATPSGSRHVFCSREARYHLVPTYQRDCLRVGERIPGPALILEAYTTTVVTDRLGCVWDGRYGRRGSVANMTPARIPKADTPQSRLRPEAEAPNRFNCCVLGNNFLQLQLKAAHNKQVALGIDL